MYLQSLPASHFARTVLEDSGRSSDLITSTPKKRALC